MHSENLYNYDKRRKGGLPIYQYFYRKAQSAPPPKIQLFTAYIQSYA